MKNFYNTHTYYTEEQNEKAKETCIFSFVVTFLDGTGFHVPIYTLPSTRRNVSVYSPEELKTPFMLGLCSVHLIYLENIRADLPYSPLTPYDSMLSNLFYYHDYYLHALKTSRRRLWEE